MHTIDPTGEAEFKIEEQYMIKARAADEKGLIRFAGTLREIAESYHEEGIRNKELLKFQCDKREMDVKFSDTHDSEMRGIELWEIIPK